MGAILPRMTTGDAMTMNLQVTLVALVLMAPVSASEKPVVQPDAAPPGMAADMPALEALVDEAMAAGMDESGVPGAVVIVVKDGQVLLAKGYGLADVEAGVPVTPHTAFRVASISKVFTATAAVRLSAQGRLDLDDDIG